MDDRTAGALSRLTNAPIADTRSRFKELVRALKSDTSDDAKSIFYGGVWLEPGHDAIRDMLAGLLDGSLALVDGDNATASASLATQRTNLLATVAQLSKMAADGMEAQKALAVLRSRHPSTYRKIMASLAGGPAAASEEGA